MSRYLIVAIDRDILFGKGLGFEKVDGKLIVRSNGQIAQVTNIVTFGKDDPLQTIIDDVMQLQAAQAGVSTNE